MWVIRSKCLGLAFMRTHFPPGWFESVFINGLYPKKRAVSYVWPPVQLTGRRPQRKDHVAHGYLDLLNPNERLQAAQALEAMRLRLHSEWKKREQQRTFKLVVEFAPGKANDTTD
jgi:hypothetical protein